MSRLAALLDTMRADRDALAAEVAAGALELARFEQAIAALEGAATPHHAEPAPVKPKGS